MKMVCKYGKIKLFLHSVLFLGTRDGFCFIKLIRKMLDTKNYSLEKHLEALCAADADYNLLLDAWRLNKNNLPNALSTIASYFPHYSRHDDSHSMTLLDNIQRLLGRDRVERLGPTDTFLILMGGLTHDLGMYMSYTFLEEEWDKPEMADLLRTYAASADKQIAAAANLLLNHRHCPKEPTKNFKWALELRNAVTLIIAQQMRGGHGDRSKDYLNRKDDLFAKMAHDFYCDAFPKRYLSLLADVAHLHGADFKELMSLLPLEDDGLRGDKVHPRFIACMIRLGDLLDVDSNRFNSFTMATLKEVPESSKAHFDKHQSVKHLLISPNGIEAELDCPTDASYRVARELFDMLEAEVEKQSQNWNLIAPDDLGGLPPVLHSDKINIYYKGTKTRPELRNLRFDISSKRTFEMLKGGAIYENPGRVFIREIVQNALDATKLQIWKDRDYYFPYHLTNPERDIKSAADIKFVSDVPQSIYNRYPINLKVEYDEEKQVVRVICEDWGTGISEESLIRMTSQVGASRKADKNYEDMVNEMPYFLQPTAAFGLGLQTVFYVANEFTVDTHYPGEPTRRIVFRSSVDGSFCSIEEENIDFKRQTGDTDQTKDVAHGTTVTIEIDTDHFGELFEIDGDELEGLKKNTDSTPYYIVSEVEKYIDDTFEHVESVPIHYTSAYQTKVFGKEETDDSYKAFVEEQNFRVGWKQDDRGVLLFRVEENKFGSDVVLSFGPDYPHGLCLRDIPIISSSYIEYSNEYVKKWNLFCRQADRFLTISRDSLLPQGEDWCRKIWEVLYPDVLRFIYSKLLEACKEACENNDVNKDSLQKQYYQFCRENWLLPNPLNVDYQLLDDYELDKGSFVKLNGDAVTAKELFETKVVADCDRLYGRDKKVMIDELRDDLKKKLSLSDDTVLCTKNDVEFPENFVCSRIVALEYISRNFVVYIVEKSVECPRFVDINPKNIGEWYSQGHVKNDYAKVILRELVRVAGIERHSRKVDLMHGLKEYEKIVVKKEKGIQLGYELPYHGNCWIYPMPVDNAEYEDAGGKELLREEMKEKLEMGYIKELVPEYLVKLIQKYNALNNDKLTAEEIYDEYIRLILDVHYGYQAPEGKGK